MSKAREFWRTRARGKFRRSSFRREIPHQAGRGGGTRVCRALQAAKVDLIVLAGFMRVLKGDFLRAFEGRIVNIHPSLLPSFPGLEAWKQALDHGVKVAGCTVHFVDAGVDSGAIIGQQTVPVLDTTRRKVCISGSTRRSMNLYPKVRRGDGAGKFRWRDGG
jgi:phosphoribosylglycinamide formyltransferase-1